MAGNIILVLSEWTKIKNLINHFVNNPTISEIICDPIEPLKLKTDIELDVLVITNSLKSFRKPKLGSKMLFFLVYIELVLDKDCFNYLYLFNLDLVYFRYI